VTGTATCLITPNQAAGTVTLTATFAGDALFDASSASTMFTVTKEETTLKFTASSPTVLANGHTDLRPLCNDHAGQRSWGAVVHGHDQLDRYGELHHCCQRRRRLRS